MCELKEKERVLHFVFWILYWRCALRARDRTSREQLLTVKEALTYPSSDFCYATFDYQLITHINFPINRSLLTSEPLGQSVVTISNSFSNEAFFDSPAAEESGYRGIERERAGLVCAVRLGPSAISSTAMRTQNFERQSCL